MCDRDTKNNGQNAIDDLKFELTTRNVNHNHFSTALKHVYCLSSCHTHFAHCCSAWYFKRHQHFILRKTLSLSCSLALCLLLYRTYQLTRFRVAAEEPNDRQTTSFVSDSIQLPAGVRCHILKRYTRSFHSSLLLFFSFSSFPFHFSIAAGEMFCFAFFFCFPENGKRQI